MSSFLCLNKLILNIKHIVFYLIYKYGSDKLYLRFYFHSCMGYWMDFKHPKTFNEKLQWLKLYDRKPIYTTMVDKYAVKQYVANIIGEQYIIPTLGVWNSFEEIDFDSLPNQFVLKCTHDSGTVIVCKNKNQLDVEQARINLSQALQTDYYKKNREWPYKNVQRRIIAEKYMEDNGSSYNKNGLADYKFYCFAGEPMYCQVIRDRFLKETIDFYDMEWNHMPFIGLNENVCHGSTPVEKPIQLNTMIEICRKLSKDIPFSRIDLYIIDEKEYFGEVTFYPNSGTGTFKPEEWAEKLGDLIKLPGKSGGGYNILIYNNIIKTIGYKKDNGLFDYKYFCFNGKVKAMYIASDRQNAKEDTKFDFFDENFSHLDIENGHPMAVVPPSKPVCFEEMKSLAERLSIGIPHVRVDFFEVDGKVYFGEMTFFHMSGTVPFKPSNWDNVFGSWIELPTKK